jgi:hypothetical protein
MIIRIVWFLRDKNVVLGKAVMGPRFRRGMDAVPYVVYCVLLIAIASPCAIKAVYDAVEAACTTCKYIAPPSQLKVAEWIQALHLVISILDKVVSVGLRLMGEPTDFVPPPNAPVIGISRAANNACYIRIIKLHKKGIAHCVPSLRIQPSDAPAV